MSPGAIQFQTVKTNNCKTYTFSSSTSPSQVSAQCQKWFLTGSTHCNSCSQPLIFPAYKKGSTLAVKSVEILRDRNTKYS